MKNEIVLANRAFQGWPEVHRLLAVSFAYMNGVVDPPSSVHALDLNRLIAKAAQEQVFLAYADAQLVGCVFCDVRDDVLYVGKLAVAESFRKQGIARALIAAAETAARQLELTCLELQVRIELAENYRAFVAMGFHKTAETAHAGYDRPTSMTMRKNISG